MMRGRSLAAVACLLLALVAGAALRLAAQTEPSSGTVSGPPAEEMPPAASPSPSAAEGGVGVLPGVVTDGVAAQVNDRVITIAELRSFLRPLLLQMRRNLRGEEYREAVKNAQRDALEQLIERRLIVDDFRSQELQVPKEWIEKQMTEDVLQRFSGDRLEFLKALREQGMTYEEYRTQIEERLIVQAMRARKLGEVNIPPGEVIAYFEQNRDEFRQEGQVRLRMIQIERPAAAESLQVARDQAEELLRQIDSGAAFDELARQYSRGLHNEEGGDWGWVGRGSLRPELEEVAFALEPGRHSGVIETDSGYYILRVDDKKPEQYQPIEEVRLQIQERLQENARARKYREWIEQLRRKAYVKKF